MSIKHRPALTIVADEPPADELREQSARAGKHLSDAMRLTIMSRNWNAVHIAADRRAPVSLPEIVRRGWR